MQIGILEPEDFSSKAIIKLNQIGKLKFYDGKNLEKFLCKLDILFIRLSYNINQTFLKKCNKLKWICSPTTGLNHIDLDAVKEKKVNLITLKTEKSFLKSIKATPEHTLGLIIAILRKYKIAVSDIDSEIWDRNKCKGEELNGNKVGIIGLGRVGFQVAHYCETLGSKIFWFDVKNIKCKSKWVKTKSLEELIKKSKIIVLCADYNSNEGPILNEKEINLLSRKYLINTARGELIDEEYLLKFITKNVISGIALDVIKNENSKNNLKIWKRLSKKYNIFITPHIGGATKVSMEKTEIHVVDKLKLALVKENKY